MTPDTPPTDETDRADDHPETLDAHREQLAAAFDRDVDPLAEYAPRFDSMDADPFELFLADVLAGDRAEGTVEKYRRTWAEWADHMADEGRHPACPSEAHVRRFIRYQLTEANGDGNTARTVRGKLRKLHRAFRYWQSGPRFPHSADFDPFDLARERAQWAVGETDEKAPPRLSVDELREAVADVTHVRDRAMVVLQLKLGLRATEVANVQLQDFHIDGPDVLAHYDDMGTHPRLDGRKNAIYVPPSATADVPAAGREGNKSKRPRVLPLDAETRRVLLRYLLARPDAGEPWLFLSSTGWNRLRRDDVNRAWTPIRDRYPETDHHAAITSHYGRHFFTTYWRVERDVNREVVKYLRGDVVEGRDREAIDEYLHTGFDDVEKTYRAEIFTLGL